MKEVKSPKKPLIYYYGIVLLIILIFNTVVSPLLMNAKVQEVDYGTFMKMIEEKNIGRVEIDDSEIVFTDKDEAQIYKTGEMNDPTLTERLYECGAEFTRNIQQQTSPLLSFLLTFVLPVIIFTMLGQYMAKKMMNQAGGPNAMAFGMGKSNAKVYVPSSGGIRFSDVAGEDVAKENLAEIVDYMHNPQKYTDVGASMPKGVLLVGPPGTGKTMLAKAVAGESGVPFFSMSGSEFVEMFVGMGASKVRDLFRQAKEKAPCIVFIDEIDAIGKKRDGQIGGNDEREQTLNQLLTEMDGFGGNNGVIILAATNRPESLDPALTRPGRFDRRVPVELPDLAGREAILRVHAKKIKTAPDVDFHVIARMAAGTSGAELANIINEAALRAVRNNRTTVCQADLEESIEVVIAGYQKKNAIMTDGEKKVVAYHEIGHALVAALQTDSAPVQKITIIPRTSGALGYTMQVEQNDKVLMTREDAGGLYDERTSNKKVQDMKRRIEIIEKTDPVLTVSIHQNSYPEEYVHGAQVFYNTQAGAAETALSVQQALNRSVNPGNEKFAREIDKTIYLMKEIDKPGILVECGFLSNEGDARLLQMPVHQTRLGAAIAAGYLEQMTKEQGRSP